MLEVDESEEKLKDRAFRTRGPFDAVFGSRHWLKAAKRLDLEAL